MLAILELIFTVVGIYVIITGKIPRGFFKQMFGPGDYNLTSGKVRLWGLFLVTPIPVVFMITILIMLLFPDTGRTIAIVFEILYIVFVGGVSIIIAKKLRSQETPMTGSQERVLPPQ